MSLAACGAKQDTPAETVAPETEAPTEAAEWSKTIVDVEGNEITLEGPATRLVCTHTLTTNMAVILGGGKYIAGFGNKEMPTFCIPTSIPSCRTT